MQPNWGALARKTVLGRLIAGVVTLAVAGFCLGRMMTTYTGDFANNSQLREIDVLTLVLPIW